MDASPTYELSEIAPTEPNAMAVSAALTCGIQDYLPGKDRAEALCNRRTEVFAWIKEVDSILVDTRSALMDGQVPRSLPRPVYRDRLGSAFSILSGLQLGLRTLQTLEQENTIHDSMQSESRCQADRNHTHLTAGEQYCLISACLSERALRVVELLRILAHSEEEAECLACQKRSTDLCCQKPTCWMRKLRLTDRSSKNPLRWIGRSTSCCYRRNTLVPWELEPAACTVLHGCVAERTSPLQVTSSETI